MNSLLDGARIEEILIKDRIARRSVDSWIFRSIPGMIITSAATMLAEIEDLKDFDKAEKLALGPAWFQLD